MYRSQNKNKTQNPWYVYMEPSDINFVAVQASSVSQSSLKKKVMSYILITESITYMINKELHIIQEERGLQAETTRNILRFISSLFFYVRSHKIEAELSAATTASYALH